MEILLLSVVVIRYLHWPRIDGIVISVVSCFAQNKVKVEIRVKMHSCMKHEELCQVTTRLRFGLFA